MYNAFTNQDPFVVLSIQDRLLAKESAQAFTNLSRKPILGIVQGNADYTEAFESIFLAMEDSLAISFKHYFLRAHQHCYRAVFFLALQTDYLQSLLTSLEMVYQSNDAEALSQSAAFIALLGNLHATMLIANNDEELQYVSNVIKNITQSSRYTRIVYDADGNKVNENTVLSTYLQHIIKQFGIVKESAQVFLDGIFKAYPSLKVLAEQDLTSQAFNSMPSYHMLFAMRHAMVKEAEDATN